jgi:hypothetical protein
MIVAIDTETTLRLRALIGTRLVRIVGHRYPNPASYDYVQLTTDEGTITHVSLQSQEVGEKLEVFYFSARQVDTLTLSDPCDDVRPADFRIDQVRVCRRAEWLDSSDLPGETVGGNPEEQRFGAPDEAPLWATHALVDAGLLFLDERGSMLFLEADAFPLVIQCHYSLASAQLPRGDERNVGS